MPGSGHDSRFVPPPPTPPHPPPVVQVIHEARHVLAQEGQVHVHAVARNLRALGRGDSGHAQVQAPALSLAAYVARAG